MKTRTRVWLLKSNNERIFDEFAPNANNFNHRDENEKQYLYEEIKENAPESKWPVAIAYEYDDISLDKDGNIDGVAKINTFIVPFMGYELIQQLEGRLLDYVDATYADKDQRESQKRIIRRTIWDFKNRTVEMNERKFKNAVVAREK